MNEEKLAESVGQTTPPNVVLPKENASQPSMETMPPVNQVPMNQPRLEEQTPSSEEKQEQESASSKEGGKLKYIMTAFLFIMLLLMVYFLPEISDGIKHYKAGQRTPVATTQPKVETGVMQCTLKKKTNTKTVTAVVSFHYKTEKLKKTTTETTTLLNEAATGEDLTILEEQESSCKHFETVVKEVPGMDVSCTKTAKLQTTNETIDYEKLQLDLLKENIAEFEGIYPEFQLDQDMNDIQKIMESSGYTCLKK